LTLPDWTPAERNRLCRLKAKWARRALGHDARFMYIGTRAGRIPLVMEMALHVGKRRP